jgi:ArsR family transcriptional regulator, arsenate/arsenite/antimonite-responsive transcriptional repressor
MRSQNVFKALADQTRRDILKMLREKPLTAGEIAEAFPMTKGSLSHHFNLLKEADLVRCERRGQFQVYSLNTTVVEDVMSLLAEVFGERGKGKKR